MKAKSDLCLGGLAKALSRGLVLIVCFFFGNARIYPDTLYVSDFANNAIERFDSSGNGEVFANTDLDGPLGIAFDSSGNLYVANQNNNTIVRFDTGGNGTVFANANSGLDIPHGLAFDTNGNLYVSNVGNSTIVKLDANGNGTVFSTAGLNVPSGLAFDSSGNLYAANWGDSTVVRFDSSGNESLFATGLDYPQGLAFDSSGNLFAVNYGDNGPIGHATVEKFAPDGTSSLFANSYMYRPADLAFDSGGNLYVASTGNSRIVKFDSTGNAFVFADQSSGVPYTFFPYGIAVQVPKPTITLLGDNPLTNECHTAFTDPGATASEDGTDLSSNIVVSGTMDANMPGTYTLTYTVVDALGNRATATRTIIVVDTTPPVITCPANIVVSAVFPKGVFVSFVVTATDECSTATVTSTPSSGSLFAIGDTTVTCTAIDGSGNQSACHFNVHVKGAAEQINDLIALVRALNLKPWTTYVLTAELQSASNALRRGNTRAACIDLDVFIFEVDVQTWWGQIWPPSRARLLVRQAQRIQNVLGCDHWFGPGHY
jgi:DNA-binding beta-propeller fold protein YncE